MAGQTASGLVVVRSSFWAAGDGRPRLVRQGEVWAAESAIAQGNPNSFLPLEIHGLDEVPAIAAAEAATRRSSDALAERRALVARAKELGIPATGKSDALREAIAAAEAAT